MAVIELDVIEDHERFRAELASIAPDGKRKWIYARQQKGRYYRWRTILSWFLLAFLFASPFITIGGHQFLLFNIIDRKFVFFGVPFWPNDFYLVALMFLTGVVTIVLFTATLGRLWCGWLCPQTIFMEMVFRKIEWLIDGPPKEAARRDAGPWNWDRVWRFAVKVLVFYAISFAIANAFLAYVISSDVLLQYVTDGPFKHLELFGGLLFFSFVFFMVFFRFREQACLIACPYGRYMSALVDSNTIAVSYDYKRGEPRAKWTRDDTTAKKNNDGDSFQRPNGQGDCVDCHQCVTVCPTGIDIRNGIQLECVNCTACIDACDEVMDKVGLKRGLVRYSSQTAIEQGRSHWFTKRIGAYLAVWLVLICVLCSLFLMRSELDVKVLRQEGTTWVQTANGLGNFYRLQIINKSNTDLAYQLELVSPSGATLTPIGLPAVARAQQIVKGRFIVAIPDSLRTGSTMKISLAVRSRDALIHTATTSFIGP